jgi:hypothetical protein
LGILPALIHAAGASGIVHKDIDCTNELFRVLLAGVIYFLRRQGRNMEKRHREKSEDS